MSNFTIRHIALCLKNTVNSSLSVYEPWQIVVSTFLLTYALFWLRTIIDDGYDLLDLGKKWLYRQIRKLPAVKRRVESHLSNASPSIEIGFMKNSNGLQYICELPHRGRSVEDVVKLASQYHRMVSQDWAGGKTSGCVYNGSDELTELHAKVHRAFAWTNPLHADVFPDVRKMEAEVTRISANLFNGGPDACGIVTIGGTESIFMAMKAYRDRAFERGIKRPEIIICRTGHAAFDKSANFLGMSIKYIPVSETFQVDLVAMRRAISKRTCVLVGSFPNYPYGVCDDIEAIAALGRYYQIPVHVDSCLGGFLVPFVERAGFDIAPFDFRVPGVTSISADTHKYGYAPKGSSVLLFANKDLRRYAYFSCVDWPGGIYATPTVAGSRAGSLIAGCWATFMYMGLSGYVDATRRIIGTTRYITKGLHRINGIYVFGDPRLCVVGFNSLDFNIFSLLDKMNKRGWHLNALQFPSGVHICVTLRHCQPGVADMFLNDVSDISTELLADSSSVPTEKAVVYGTSQQLPDRSIVVEFTHRYLDAMFATGDYLSDTGAQNGSVG